MNFGDFVTVQTVSKGIGFFKQIILSVQEIHGNKSINIFFKSGSLAEYLYLFTRYKNLLPEKVHDMICGVIARD